MLVENINTYIFEPEEGQFDESLNYPVFLFLIKNPSIIYFDYVEKKLCDESYSGKFDMLLLAATNSSKSKTVTNAFLNNFLNNECLEHDQLSNHI